MLRKLSSKEQAAIEILREHGWQTITGAHLEDWDEGQSVKTEYCDDEAIDVRSDIAIIKL